MERNGKMERVYEQVTRLDIVNTFPLFQCDQRTLQNIFVDFDKMILIHREMHRTQHNQNNFENDKVGRPALSDSKTKYKAILIETLW